MVHESTLRLKVTVPQTRLMLGRRTDGVAIYRSKPEPLNWSTVVKISESCPRTVSGGRAMNELHVMDQRLLALVPMR